MRGLSVRHHRHLDHVNAADDLPVTNVSEDSPNVIQEALACDLPIVSVDGGDVLERIAQQIVDVYRRIARPR